MAVERERVMTTITVAGTPRKLRAYRQNPPRGRLLGARPGALPDPPPHIDLTAVQSAVDDQGQTSSCTAHAWCSAAEALAIHDLVLDGVPLEKARARVVRLSRYGLYFHTRVLVAGGSPTEDAGCVNSDVARAFEAYGTPSADLWPDDEAHFAVPPSGTALEDARGRVALLTFSVPTLRHVKLSLAEGFPVVVGAGIPQSMETSEDVFRTGVIPLPSDADPIAGGHDMLIVAYDDEKRRVKVKNSWGESFGEEGYGYLSYDFFGPSQDADLAVSSAVANECWTVRAEEGA